jgi:hypothetical protein
MTTIIIWCVNSLQVIVVIIWCVNSLQVIVVIILCVNSVPVIVIILWKFLCYDHDTMQVIVIIT